REPHRDLAFDADTDIVAIAQLGAAVVNALREYTAAAGMGDVEILLHHRAGAADLVTDQAACLRQQQIVDRALYLITFRLVAWHKIRRKRRQRRAIAARGGDDLCGRESFVHRRRLSCLQGAALTAQDGQSPPLNALLVPLNLLAPLVTFLRFPRQRCNRASLQPLERDRLAGLLAIAVGVVLDALQRGVDLGDQFALAVAGAQFDGAIGFGRGAISQIGMIDVLFLEGLQANLRFPQDLVLPRQQLGAKIIALAV